MARRGGRRVGWVAMPIQPDALDQAMTEKGVGPVWVADAIRLRSGMRVSHQRISQLRAQREPAGCRLDLAEQISKVLEVPFALMWRVEPTNEATRRLSDPRALGGRAS